MMTALAVEVMGMGESPASKTTYLALDQLAENRRLARRLPLDLARRFHALPLAEDNGRVTVAMADPANAEARAAVVSALGPLSCVVQGDATAIDTLLSRIWATEADCRPSLLVCAFPEPISGQAADYIRDIGELLEAHVDCLTTAGSMGALSEGRVDHDLIVFGGPEHPLIHHWLSQPSDRAPVSRPNHLPLGILVTQQPRWPLRRILLVAQGESGDDAALDWVLRLAKVAGSAVTVLVVVPPVPAMYGQNSRIGQGLPALLSADSPLGRQVRHVSRRLVDCEVAGILRLRQGPPEWQICREITEGGYDLVALAATQCAWWRRCLEGDLAGFVLRRAGRPVLVTKPTIA
jgi:nucleotide-binding universal stress UspA family protein